VVMPAGHTGPFRFGQPRPEKDEFVEDFKNDIVPYVENHYRVKKDSKNTAIAGLSMGGSQTLNIIISDLERYGYIGVYSSGIFGIVGDGRFGSDAGPSWEEQHKEILDNADLKKGIKLFWFATGNEDFLIETSRATVKMLKNHGFDLIYKESSGGHTWINWREYLYDFAQLLFK
jgi:enterochelin esterase-like enzyme